MAVSAPKFAVEALVFDAYGTLFDVHSVGTTADKLLPGRGAALSVLWRMKQLEYTWLQSLMGPAARQDFAAVTALALDYALAALDAPLDVDRRRELRDAYLMLAPYDDVAAALAALAPRPAGYSTARSRCWSRSFASAGSTGYRRRSSVDAAGVYKPSPSSIRSRSTSSNCRVRALALSRRIAGMRSEPSPSASRHSGSTARARGRSARPGAGPYHPDAVRSAAAVGVELTCRDGRHKPSRQPRRRRMALRPRRCPALLVRACIVRR